VVDSSGENRTKPGDAPSPPAASSIEGGSTLEQRESVVTIMTSSKAPPATRRSQHRALPSAVHMGATFRILRRSSVGEFPNVQGEQGLLSSPSTAFDSMPPQDPG
jgi:hypothetical protein